MATTHETMLTAGVTYSRLMRKIVHLSDDEAATKSSKSKRISKGSS